MAIVRVEGKRDLDRRVAVKVVKKAAKKGAEHTFPEHAAKKQAAKKHSAKKHAAKKQPAKKSVGQSRQDVDRSDARESQRLNSLGEVEADARLLSDAFHHLQRASALISLLEPNSGGDLRKLLEHGIALYRAALTAQAAQGVAEGTQVMQCAVGLLRAAEHLAMAGLYTAREEFRERVEPRGVEEVKRHLSALRPRVEQLGEPEREQAKRLHAMARELLRRAAETDGSDPHLDYELTMAADGLCSALEKGV